MPLPEGERRQLTVVFCDLVGSTPLSQQLDAEEWRDLIERYEKTAARAVARWGGHVAKALGDGLLIYFGWPSAREDDPERAVRSGLAILDEMAILNAKLAPEGAPRLVVRIGMHTGRVVVDEDGEIFGETANVAARVQSMADPDMVFVTAATQRLVAGIFVVEDRGPCILKGVREPVTLYRIIQPSGVRSRLDIAGGRLTPFVGRELDLATLVDRWERTQDGNGQNVLILGEAGLGKSRLVYQLREHLGAVPHTWLECAATPYTEGTPFHPIIALVSQGLAFTQEDTSAEKVGKIERGLRTLASGDAVALLADFLGLPPTTPLAISPELRRRKTIDLLAQWSLALGAVQPLVLLVEDLHWCDASSLEVLECLVAQSQIARVLLVATARPQFSARWPARENVTTLQLARLINRQARNMVQAVCAWVGERGLGTGATTDPPPLASEIIDALVDRACGVPLYIEELTKTVVEPGGAPTVEEIPDTLADSLMARLDRLSAAKEVAQRAAVLGREFSYPLLAAVAGLEEAALRHGLARLVEAEIVFVRGELPQATYTFKHALVQEAAYGSLLKRTRQRLHGRIAEVLVAAFPERAAAEPEVVARHAEMAGQIDAAVTYYQQAGEHAQARPAHEEAIRHLRHAMALLATRSEAEGRNTREVALQLALGGSLGVARGFAHPETEIAYERARVLCEATGDAAPLGHALIGLAVFYYNRGEVERGRTLAARVLTTAEQRGDESSALYGHAAAGIAEFYQGKFTSSLAHCDAGRKLYDSGHHAVSVLAPDPGVTALAYAAWNLWFLGWPERARRRAAEAVVLARQLCRPFNLAEALSYQTAVDWLRGDVASQRMRAAEVVALSESQGFPLWLGLGSTFRASARVALGEPGAVDDVLAGLAVAAGTGSQAAAPALFALLGEVHMVAGQRSETLAAVETGLAIAAQTGQPFWNADLYRLKGEIILANGGKAIDAEALFHRALAIARGQAAKSFELRAAMRLARLWRDANERAEARGILGPIYGWFTEGFETRDLIEAKTLLEELQ